MDQGHEGSHVFVSHANADKSRIRVLVARLLDEDLPIWIDRPEELGLDERFLRCGRIRSGADWQQQIDFALESSACVLFVLSRASNAPERSNALYREFQHGVRNDSLVMVSIDPSDDFEPLPHYRIRQSRDLSPLAAGDSAHRGANARLLIVLQELREKIAEHRRKLPGSAAEAEAEHSPSHAPLLPYFTDRVNQQRRLSEALKRAMANELVSPMTFVALGTDDDCLDTFVQQVRYKRLPALLASRLPGNRLFTATFVWSLDDGDTSGDLDEEVRALVAEQFQQPDASRRQIADRLSAAQGCWLLQLNLSLQGGPRRCCDALRAWVRWWAQPEFVGFRSPVLTLVCIAAPSSWLLRLLAQSPMSRVRRALQTLLTGDDANARAYLLPKFRSLRFTDVESVIHELGDDIDREVFRRRLRQAFCFLGVLPGRRLSMYQAASCIKRLVADPITKLKASA